MNYLNKKLLMIFFRRLEVLNMSHNSLLTVPQAVQIPNIKETRIIIFFTILDFLSKKYLNR